MTLALAFCAATFAPADLVVTNALVWSDGMSGFATSLAVDEGELFERALEVAKKLAAGSPSAIRWTKHALNNWLRMMGPIFDNSIALECLGFTGPDLREGLASLKEKRAPRFDPKAQV